MSSRFLVWLAWLFVFVVRLPAEAAIPPGGVAVLSADWSKDGKFGQKKDVSTGAVAVFPNGNAGWRLQVLDGRSAATQIQFNVPVAGSIAAGDRLLLAFQMRCLPESSDGGVGEGRIAIEIKDPPDYTKIGQDAFKATGEWQTYHYPFIADAAAVAEKTFVSFMLGGRKQSLELSQVTLLNYGPDFPIDKLPRPYLNYPGRAVDAPWRKAALERIEKIRTTDIVVEVVDAAGKPVAGAKVEAHLQRHAFAFGAAVKAKFFSAEHPDGPRYQKLVGDNFSAIVLENDLKPFALKAASENKGKEYRHEWTQQAMAWAKDRRMKVRGHYLCWGPWEPWSEELKSEPAKIRERILQHLDAVLRAGAGYVDVWDAVNHPVGWETPRRTVDQVIDPGFYAEVFREARKRSPLPLCINEDQVFRPGRQQDEFYDCIRDLITRGVVPDSIGNQAHFHSSFLPGPEEGLAAFSSAGLAAPEIPQTTHGVKTWLMGESWQYRCSGIRG